MSVLENLLYKKKKKVDSYTKIEKVGSYIKIDNK